MTKLKPKKEERRLETALAACRSIRFAFEDSKRHGGEFNLIALEAALRLANQALRRP